MNYQLQDDICELQVLGENACLVTYTNGVSVLDNNGRKFVVEGMTGGRDFTTLELEDGDVVTFYNN